MSAFVHIGEKGIRMSNGSWEQVVDDALTVAKALATKPHELEFITELNKRAEAFFSGYAPDLAEIFPADQQRMFWAMCFREAGRWLHLGKLDNPLRAGTPALQIFYSYWCAYLLEDSLVGSKTESIYLDEDSRLRQAAYEQHMAEIRGHQAERQSETKPDA